MTKRQIPLAIPGEILPEELLKPLSVTQYRLTKDIGVPQRRMGEVVAGKRSITADTAARLVVFFGMEAEFWLNLQAHYDLALTHEGQKHGGRWSQPIINGRPQNRMQDSSAQRWVSCLQRPPEGLG